MTKLVTTRIALKTSEVKEILNRHFGVPASYESEFRVWDNYSYQFSVTGVAELEEEKKEEGMWHGAGS